MLYSSGKVKLLIKQGMTTLLTQWSKSGTPTPPNAGNVEQKELSLLVRMQNAANVENSLVAPQKLNTELPHDPAIPWYITERTENIHSR